MVEVILWRGERLRALQRAGRRMTRYHAAPHLQIPAGDDALDLARKPLYERVHG